MVQCGNDTDVQPFGQSHYRGIDGPEGKVVISADKLRNAQPIAGMHRLCNEISGREISKESYL